jgi:chromate transport protein ChrA
MIAAMAFVSGGDPRIAGALHGILVAAVALLLVSFVRLSRNTRSRSDIAFATSTLLMTLAGVPLIVTILTVGGVGVWRYRPRGEPAE